MKKWSDNELERYSRQIILPDIGVEGQDAIFNSKVLVVGAGGLGSPVLLYLASAGIGLLEIIDFDVVEYSNLHRQILHKESAVGLNKSISAKQTLNILNPNVEIKANPIKLTLENALKTLSPYDFIIDCSDNFYTKLLINKACYKLKKPFNIAGALQYQGQCTTIFPNLKTPCYRCLFPNVPFEFKTCASEGILGPVVGIIGLLQATEVLKYLSGQLPIKNSLLCFDAKTMEMKKLSYFKNKKCEICSESPKDT